MAKARTPHSARLVVVGSDFSDGAKRAVARAALVARGAGCRLAVVNVVPEYAEVAEAPLPGEWRAPGQLPGGGHGDASHEGARAAERRIAAEVGVADAETIVREGRPHEALMRLAEERHARLLVLGVHAPMAPYESFFLGSTAERALRTGSTPVLLARRDDVRPYGRILVPVDLGDVSIAVLRLVAETFPEAAYDVVHFLPPTTSRVVTHKERHDTFLASLSGLALGAGLSPARTRVRVFIGEPREGILTEAKGRHPDLIAMGTHARTGMARVLLGSVADYVLHAASSVDVLVVPPVR